MTLRQRLGLAPRHEAAFDETPVLRTPPPPRKPRWVERQEEERARNLRETGHDLVATRELTR